MPSHTITERHKRKSPLKRKSGTAISAKKKKIFQRERLARLSGKGR